uniref:Uncharacterized protein n=1 Tax=Vitis vinifera TaxID=29760 RepID=A5C402_VITVI|nr:hypothetical protein VITISV_000374 [Vitis vinifera]
MTYIFCATPNATKSCTMQTIWVKNAQINISVKANTNLEYKEYGILHITPDCASIYTRLRRHLHLAAAASTRMYYIRKSTATIPPGCIAFGIMTPDGRGERFNFQSDISGSADSAHPEDFAAILHSTAVFS